MLVHVLLQSRSIRTATVTRRDDGRLETSNEPRARPGGQSEGPSPRDLVLGALTTCQDITYKAGRGVVPRRAPAPDRAAPPDARRGTAPQAYATAMGIPLAKVETSVEGDLVRFITRPPEAQEAHGSTPKWTDARITAAISHAVDKRGRKQKEVREAIEGLGIQG